MFTIDYVSLAIAAVLIALFITPLYLHVRKTNRSKADALRRLHDFASSKGWLLTNSEIWRNRYFIGLDEMNLGLVYSNDIGDHSAIAVPLSEIQRVRVIERSHRVSINTEKRKVIDAIDLQLIGKDGNVLHELEIYDGNRYSDLDGESVLVGKWEGMLKKVFESSVKKIPIE
ncbi:hypothetical protein [Lunatimonas lonarensis]|uniref:hypothetical protein n=1 Tax=Lunatimonas lonarensis TaxID=1232681 RepID=UPI000561AC40|nr:hypothetical protein [Lunatimonas lonarensis]